MFVLLQDLGALLLLDGRHLLDPLHLRHVAADVLVQLRYLPLQSGLLSLPAPQLFLEAESVQKLGKIAVDVYTDRLVFVLILINIFLKITTHCLSSVS